MKPKKHNAQRDFLYIAVSFFILTMLWIGFSLYHIRVTSTISQDLQMQVTPINPNFDMSVIQELQEREHVTPLSNFAQTGQEVGTKAAVIESNGSPAGP